MSIVTDSNTATPDPAPLGASAARPAAQEVAELVPESAVERALAAAIKDASRIGELLDVLRRARLWLPLTPAESRRSRARR